jgi:diguanylate cyclase (GGDEF)-like protein
MVDIDHFKKVNDTHGHQVGDKILMETSKLLEDRVEGKGTAYRYGGEELAVLLKNYTSEEAAALAEVFRADTEKAQFSDGIHISVSIGIASLPSHARDSGELLKAADDALYQAKRLGRNLVRVSGEPEVRPPGPRTPVRRQPAPLEEQEILQEAAKAGGQILWVTTDQSPSFISVGGKFFPSSDKLDMYESKRARQKLQSLLRAGLIELVSRGISGDEIYELTVKGFETAGYRGSAT